MSRVSSVAAVFTLALVASVSSAALQQPKQQPKASTEQATAWTADKGEWMPLPDIFPAGGQMKVMRGDPAKGPADFYFKFPAGYGVPWHFHTPVEVVLMDRGTIEFEMRGGQKVALGEGGYIHFPSASPHKATCTANTECLFYLVSSGPFDIHLVDDKWNTTKSWRAWDPQGTAERR